MQCGTDRRERHARKWLYRFAVEFMSTARNDNTPIFQKVHRRMHIREIHFSAKNFDIHAYKKSSTNSQRMCIMKNMHGFKKLHWASAVA